MEVNEPVVESRSCPACHRPAKGKFCMHCGEQIVHETITLNYLLKHIPDLFDLEKGLFYTISRLFVRPGLTLRKYFAGDRMRHYKPIKYVLFLGTISTFINLFILKEYDVTPEPFYSNMEGIADGKALDSFLEEWNTVLMLIAFPVIAITSWLLFKRKPYTFGEHLVANAYLMGQYAVVMILVQPLMMLRDDRIGETATNIALWLLFFYYIYAYFDWLYGLRTFSGFIKTVCAVILCGVTMFIFLTLITPVLYYIIETFKAL